MSPRLAYSVIDAARLIGVSQRSLRYMLQQGRIGFVRLGRRVLTKHADLERLLKQHYLDRDGGEPAVRLRMSFEGDHKFRWRNKPKPALCL